MTFIDLLLFDIFPVHTTRNNTKGAPFGMPGVSNEPKKYLKFNPIIKSEIGFLL